MSARVYGSVKDSATGVTITTATVVAPPQTVTCSNGVYNITTPGAASFTITASATNYVTQNIPVSLTNGQVKQVNILLVHV